MSHSDCSGGGWASQIVGGDGKQGGLMKSWGVDTPIESMLYLLFHNNLLHSRSLHETVSILPKHYLKEFCLAGIGLMPYI